MSLGYSNEQLNYPRVVLRYREGNGEEDSQERDRKRTKK